MIRILVAEDDANTRYLIKQILTRKGYYVLEAENGLQAFQLLERFPITDLLIADIRMAQMDGLELLEQAQNHFPSVPVMMLTAHGNTEVVQTALDNGALCYLMKPFTQQQLLTMIDDILSSKVS